MPDMATEVSGGALRSVEAVRYVTALREGGSLPGLVEGDDDGTWVVKFRGAGQGPGVLVSEVIAGEIARTIGLPVPELVLVEVAPELGHAEPDPEIQELIARCAREAGVTQRAIGDQEILERCLYPMVNEGAKILEEGIAARPLDIDIIWINGYGFPAYRGGPMFWADQIGLENIVAAYRRYAEQFGAHYWTPAPLLEKLAREGKAFYDL